MDYRVALDIYKGPLDLLLYLIRENEVDIYDIPIAAITEQYMQYLELIKMLDPNLAGDFLVMASTLMEIKSRMLLPRPEREEDEADEDDPRIELIRQLMEYKRFKEAAAALAEKREEQLDRFGRGARQSFDEEAPEEESVELSEVSIWDILTAFDRVMRETLRLQPATIRDRDVPVRQHIEQIIEMLRVQNVIRFVQIFERCEDRVEAIGAFLALLEMTRGHIIAIEQGADRGMITIRLVSEEKVERFLREVSESLNQADETGRAASDEPGPGEEATTAGEPDEQEDEAGDDEDLAKIRDIEIQDVVLSRETRSAEPETTEKTGEENPTELIDDETVADLRTSDVPLPETESVDEPTDEEPT